MRAEFPKALEFLFVKHRYKGVRGGRGKGASWGVARALLTIGTGKVPGYEGPRRILCARETQKSIADSVHTLLSDQIKAMGMQAHYEVQQNTILGRNGTEFIFAGLRHNINNIKSVEGCDIVWVEEAQSVSKNSWDTLIPTIRKEGSEIWASWNDILETDDTYVRFVLNQPPGAVIKKLTYRDNPWFPDVLRIEMEHLRETDEAAYRHVWEGECKSAVEGAVYAAEIAQATTQGRITTVSYDRTKPVHTVWDLGYGDATAIWFVQTVNGWYHLIDYIEDNGRTIEWYLIQLQQKGYVYGNDWLPHDGVDTIIHQKLGGGDRSRSIEMIMRGAGRQVRIVPKMLVTDGINAARTIFPQCRFDSVKCYEGLRALRMYQWGPPSPSGVLKREPLHDAASHGADAFRGIATAIQHEKAPPPAKLKPPTRRGVYAPFG